MRNAGLEETQAGIKIAGKNINNFRYADDTTLMAESEEELKSLLMKVKEESEKVDLKLNIQKTKIMTSGPIIHGKWMGKQWKQCQNLFWGGSKITADGKAFLLLLSSLSGSQRFIPVLHSVWFKIYSMVLLFWFDVTGILHDLCPAHLSSLISHLFPISFWVPVIWCFVREGISCPLFWIIPTYPQ